MFTKRTIRKAVPVTHVDTSVEALSVSMGEKAAVDLEYMEGLTGKSRVKIISDLKGIIFKVPESGTWQTSEEYLSGNIRKKLISAEKHYRGMHHIPIMWNILRRQCQNLLQHQR